MKATRQKKVMVMLKLSCGCTPVGVEADMPYPIGRWVSCPYCFTGQTVIAREAPEKKKAKKNDG